MRFMHVRPMLAVLAVAACAVGASASAAPRGTDFIFIDSATDPGGPYQETTSADIAPGTSELVFFRLKNGSKSKQKAEFTAYPDDPNPYGMKWYSGKGTKSANKIPTSKILAGVKFEMKPKKSKFFTAEIKYKEGGPSCLPVRALATKLDTSSFTYVSINGGSCAF